MLHIPRIQRTPVHRVVNAQRRADREAAPAALGRARQAIAQGFAFNEVAARYSDCGAEGEIFWFSRGIMVEEFDDIVFQLATGETSSVFETDSGYTSQSCSESGPRECRP